MENTNNTIIQFKRNLKNAGVEFDINAYSTVVLGRGEPFFDTDHNLLYIGDGVNALPDLPSVCDWSKVIEKINASTGVIDGERVGKVAESNLADSTSILSSANNNKISNGGLMLSDGTTVNSKMIGKTAPTGLDESQRGRIFFVVDDWE